MKHLEKAFDSCAVANHDAIVVARRSVGRSIDQCSRLARSISRPVGQCSLDRTYARSLARSFVLPCRTRLKRSWQVSRCRSCSRTRGFCPRAALRCLCVLSTMLPNIPVSSLPVFAESPVFVKRKRFPRRRSHDRRDESLSDS